MQKDKDGKLKYCAVRIVNFGSNPIIAAFPNPAHSSLTITGMGAKDRAELLDISGRRLLILTAAGNSAEKLNISTLAAGTYQLKVTNTNGASTVVKVVKQ